MTVWSRSLVFWREIHGKCLPPPKKAILDLIHRHILRSNFSHTSDRGYPWEIPLGALGPESDTALMTGKIHGNGRFDTGTSR